MAKYTLMHIVLMGKFENEIIITNIKMTISKVVFSLRQRQQNIWQSNTWSQNAQ